MQSFLNPLNESQLPGLELCKLTCTICGEVSVQLRLPRSGIQVAPAVAQPGFSNLTGRKAQGLVQAKPGVYTRCEPKESPVPGHRLHSRLQYIYLDFMANPLTGTAAGM